MLFFTRKDFIISAFKITKFMFKTTNLPILHKKYSWKKRLPSMSYDCDHYWDLKMPNSTCTVKPTLKTRVPIWDLHCLLLSITHNLILTICMFQGVWKVSKNLKNVSSKFKYFTQLFKHPVPFPLNSDPKTFFKFQ